MFGGAPVTSNNDITVVAGRNSHRIKLTWSRPSECTRPPRLPVRRPRPPGPPHSSSPPPLTCSPLTSAAGESHPWQYEFSEWVEEDMGIPRVMGDSVLLPNGDVVLLNGAQVRSN